MSFDPSTNCIVSTYYSGSVNVASTNSQSLASSLTPVLLSQNTDKRLWQKFDRVFAFLPHGLLETILSSGSLLRKTIRKIATETISISEAIARGKALTETTNIIEGTGYTSGYYSGYEIIPGLLRKFIPHISTEISAITDALSSHYLHEIVVITEAISRKVVRKFSEVMSISEALQGAEFAGLNETVAISDMISRLVKFKRQMIEGECSLLFNGLD